MFVTSSGNRFYKLGQLRTGKSAWLARFSPAAAQEHSVWFCPRIFSSSTHFIRVPSLQSGAVPSACVAHSTMCHFQPSAASSPICRPFSQSPDAASSVFSHMLSLQPDAALSARCRPPSQVPPSQSGAALPVGCRPLSRVPPSQSYRTFIKPECV